MTLGAENPGIHEVYKELGNFYKLKLHPNKKTPGSVLSNTGAWACRQVSYSPGIADFSRNRRVLAS